MTVITTDGKYINEKYEYETQTTNYHEKIKHMLDNGYGSMMIDGLKVSYYDTIKTYEEDIIIVQIGDD